MTEIKKPDFITQTGKEVYFDLTKMTYGQWLGLFDPKESDEKSNITVARVSGLTTDELNELGFLEYKKMFNSLLKRAREPLENPND